MLNKTARFFLAFVGKYGIGSSETVIRDRKAYEEAYFGGMWQADTCYLPYIRENGKSRRVYLIMILDDHSRMIVGGKLYYQENAANFQNDAKRRLRYVYLENTLCAGVVGADPVYMASMIKTARQLNDLIVYPKKWYAGCCYGWSGCPLHEGH